MKKALLNLNPEKILFFDVECANEGTEFYYNDKKFALFKHKHRDKDTDKELAYPAIEMLYESKAALNPIYGKIVCLSVGFINKDSIRLKTFEGDEREIISGFVDLVDSVGDYTLCNWNMDFALPYLRKRALISGCTNYLSDKNGNDSMEKPWTIRGILDLGNVWKGLSFYQDSMEEVAQCLGVGKETIVEGAKISEAYHNGELNTIRAQNQADISTLINIFRKLRYEAPIEEIKYSVPVQEPALLTKIANSGKLSSKDKAKLDKAVAALSKEEAPYADDIIKAAMSTK